MSLNREIRRRHMAEAMKENGMRTRCRKCGTRLTAKNGTGWVCAKCGWESEKQKQIRRRMANGVLGVLTGLGSLACVAAWAVMIAG